MSHLLESSPPAGDRRAPFVPPTVLWLACALAGAQFLQWTVIQPADAQRWLAFTPGDVDGGRWWSVATYVLVHPSATLLALNLYALLVFGPRLERSWGARRFAGFVLVAALGGWFAHLFVGGAQPLLGASAIAIGVMCAYALRWGDEVRALPGGFSARERWGVVFTAAVTLLVGMQEGIGGGLGFLAHLGGVGAAMIFAGATSVLFVEQIRDGVSAMPDEPPEDQPPRAVPKTLPRSRAQRETIDDFVARSNAEIPRASAETRRRPESERSVAPEPALPLNIDAILDKISAEGMDHLTPDERQVLDDHSRRLRDG